METFTIAEAAEAVGISKKAMRNRVDRGQVRATLRDGVRRIPRAELVRVGLIGAAKEAVQRHPSNEAASREATDLLAVRELLDRLERQAGEITSLRALTVEADSLRQEREALRDDLFEARARITELEARLARPKWRRAFRFAAAS